MSTTQTAIMNELLDPLTEALTPESAQRLAALKATPEVQARIDALADKCNEGMLTDAERAEYEDYVRVGNMLAILKAKAKAALKQSSQ